MKEFIIEQKDSGQRVDKYLLRIMPEASKSFLYKMMRKKNIVINDKKIQGNEILLPGDAIKVWFSDETFDKFSRSDNKKIDLSIYKKAFNSLTNISILYEDENYIILNKPVGVLSQKASENDYSINEWLIGYLLSNGSCDADSLLQCKPSIANRLDRNTSGIVLAGKTVYGLNILSKLIKDRAVKKYYLTYVEGNLNDVGILKGYHNKNSEMNVVNIITENEYALLPAEEKNNFSYVETVYKSLKRFNSGKTNISKAEIDLITGKSHQIRAHMASIGHPLLGDEKYGNHKLNSIYKLRHQLLHAYRVVFPTNDKLGQLSGKEIICQPGNQEALEDLFSRS